ncbi:LysR family transcriptional regulator [Nocardioides marmoriginsengisoli]|nr:LysR family transcriptional regulator [Nocardioides marmoriginsengisoli]
MIEIRSLRYFLAVADAGSVTAAADLVHVTQPSLSRQIRALERLLGFDLFDRSDKRLVLNSAGRQFRGAAEELVARFELVERTAADIASGKLTSVRLTATRTTMRDVIAPFLAGWGPEDPMPTFQDELPADIYETLTHGADLAIGTERPSDALEWIPIARLPVWAFVPAGHPWAGRDRVRLADVLDEELLVLSEEHQSRRALDAAVRAAGLGYREQPVELSTPEVAQAMVAAGRGVTALSDDPRFGLVPVPIGPRDDTVSVRLYAAWARDHHASAALGAIAARLREFCIGTYGPEAAFDR